MNYFQYFKASKQGFLELIFSKMLWEVEVISEETIKPTSPAPTHLRTHSLSWLDQAVPYDHIPCVLFYPNPDPAALSALKSSLSRALSLFYLFAGPPNHDNATVDCDDRGVELLEARAATDAPLSQLIRCGRTNIESLSRLVQTGDGGGGSAFFVQITTFVLCGGITVGWSFNHKIADGHSATAFVAAWAAAARCGPCGDDGVVPRPVFDVASRFPPPSDDFKSGYKTDEDLFDALGMRLSTKRLLTKRLVFEDKAISNLQESSSISQLSRVQALIALIWRCCMRARASARCSNNKLDRHSVASESEANDRDGARLRFEEKVSKAIKKNDVERLRRFRGGDDWAGLVYGPVIEAVEECSGVDDAEVGSYSFSSWVQFPLYEADFGWGRPIWVALAGPEVKDEVILMGRGGADGGGIEAWVTLEEEEMIQLECDEEITGFAQFV